MNETEIYDLLRIGNLSEVIRAIDSMPYKIRDKKIYVLIELIEIFRNEVTNDVKRTIFDYSTDMDELYRHYTKTKLMLRRLDFDLPSEYIDEAYSYFEGNDVSIYMLVQMAVKNMTHPKYVCQQLANLYGDKKGIMSKEAQFFQRLVNGGNSNGGN